MTTEYFRPLSRSGPRPDTALTLAGGSIWFDTVVKLSRDAPDEVVPVSECPAPVLQRLTEERTPIAGCDMGRPNLMGILNVTPDSFSDGGRYLEPDAAVAQARLMQESGAEIIDVGGESTRPGAETVDVAEEIKRVQPPISAISEEMGTPVSIDTRKAAVAEAALDAGATIVNDVSGFTFDPALAALCAARNVPVCVMHAQGDPQTMQRDPQYENVLLDVYDFLSERIESLVAQGIARSQIIIDPGIGFGKTLEHNLTLLRNLSLFHTLGCPVLLGASRKRFIGTISGADIADTRMPGSVAIALHAMMQGIQIIRVHDVAETRQAFALWRAVEFGEL